MTQWNPKNNALTWWIALLLCLFTISPAIAGFLVLMFKGDFSYLNFNSHSSELQNSILFTLKQASISSLIVLIFSPILSIGSFFLPNWINRISSTLRPLLFCLPSVVIASAIILTWGNNGLATHLLESIFSSNPFNQLVYSKYAVIFANTLMNLPFASFMIGRTLINIPSEEIFAAKQLGLTPLQCWKALFIPHIRPSLLYYCGLTFLMSMGSFGAISILGGGPQVQTLELGIYRSIYFSAEWDMAAIYSIAHTLIGGGVALIFIVPQYKWMSRFQNVKFLNHQNRNSIKHLICQSKWAGFFAVISVIFDLFLVIPFLCISIDAWDSLKETVALDGELLQIMRSSSLYSLLHAVPSAIICTFSGFLICRSFMRYKLRLDSKSAKTLLMVALCSTCIPSMSTAFGLLALNSSLNQRFFQDLGITFLHATLALPFIVNFMLPAYSSKIINFDMRRTMDGISPQKWWSMIEFPQMFSTFALSLAIAFSLSINETSIVTMLGDPTSPVLTTAMIRLMDHYRFGGASLISFTLTLITLVTLILVSKNSKGTHEYS